VSRQFPVAAGTLLFLVACSTVISPSPSVSLAPSPSPSPSPSPTPPPPAITTPLAVITGFTNLRAEVSLGELQAFLRDGELALPCGIVTLSIGAMPAGTPCLAADAVAAEIRAHPDRLGLIPPNLVNLSVKVLPIGGGDLFGSRTARVSAYPLGAVVDGWPVEWIGHDASQIHTLVSTGDSCADRGVAIAAITAGHGWPWVLNGGTAEYTNSYPNPTPPSDIGVGSPLARAVRAGNEGAVRAIVHDADLTVSGYECPAIADFRIHTTGTFFGSDPQVLTALRDAGVDVVTNAANHATDQGGLAGMLETDRNLDAVGIAHTGTGSNLDAALEPAILPFGDLRFAFVGLNIITGSIAATPSTAGVAWLTEANVAEAVRRAHAAADVVICMPEWWPEYHANFSRLQREWEGKLLAAGCDHILGRGTHWVGSLDFGRNAAGDPSFVISAHGNFLFGQRWSQETSEGVLVELTFRGRTLIQARFHPYAILDQAQPNLLDPLRDGRDVMERMFNATGDLDKLLAPFR